MKTVRLGDVVEIASGATPQTSNPTFWNGTILWATPADLSKLQGSEISATARTITQEGLDSCPARVLPAGSVLLSSRAPIGYVAIASAPMATNQGFKSFVPGPDVHNRYLFHWLRANTSYLRSLGNGATFKELSRQAVSRIEIPLPRIDEQRRIAAILDRADLLRRKQRQFIDHLDALTGSIFHELFGDPLLASNPWTRKRIGELAEVRTGNSPSRDASNFGGEIEWIKSNNLGPRIANAAEEMLSAAGKTRARLAPARSILVTCIAGSTQSIGKASAVDREVAFNQQINAILPSARVNSVFLHEQLRIAPDLVRQKSTGGMKGLVNKSAFSSIEVLSPPLQLQEEFARRAQLAEKAAASAAEAIRVLDELFASLQSRAFRGEL